ARRGSPQRRSALLNLAASRLRARFLRRRRAFYDYLWRPELWIDSGKILRYVAHTRIERVHVTFHADKNITSAFHEIAHVVLAHRLEESALARILVIKFLERSYRREKHVG